MSTLSTSTRQLIARLGETDQLAQHDQSISLCRERAELRQRLAAISNQKTEQLYLLGEAAVLLENALLTADEQATHVQLSAQLADLYLQFYSATHEQRYLLIVGQILKPLSQSDYPPIGWHLLRLHALSQQPALTQHWMKKLLKSGLFTWSQLAELPELEAMQSKAWQSEDWFVQLQRQYQH